jgi:hypothetical protein
MQFILSESLGIVSDRSHQHVRNFRLAKVDLSSGSFVEQSVHGCECLSGAERGCREAAIRWKAVMETPGYENWLVL